VILESLSAGRPVLISDQTPWRELEKDRCGWDVSLEVQGKGLEVKGSRLKCHGSAWCSVLGQLVQMEQDEFDGWCEGARRRAEGFVNNPALKQQYKELLG
jgi:hypothetical protein